MKRTNTTKTRTLVAAILHSAPFPIDLRELHGLVARQLPSAAFSTVYRIVRDLEAHGSVERTDWRERGSKYEWTEGREHHHHITCSACGRVHDVTEHAFTLHAEQITQETGYVLRNHRIELEGLCADCLPQAR